MHKKEHSLPGEYHIQQFHNYDHYPEHHEQARAQWWELPAPEEGPHMASGGSVVAGMRKKGPQKFGLHPAHGIPGIHIVTADAGEPIFTGEK